MHALNIFSPLAASCICFIIQGLKGKVAVVCRAYIMNHRPDFCRHQTVHTYYSLPQTDMRQQTAIPYNGKPQDRIKLVSAAAIHKYVYGNYIQQRGTTNRYIFMIPLTRNSPKHAAMTPVVIIPSNMEPRIVNSNILNREP